MYLTYKNIGETPLECLERLRVEEGINIGVPMTYAGRLDPMAEGLLIILTGEECHDKEKYLNLNKEYEVEILFGVYTDTQDVLGLIEKIEIKNSDLNNFDKYIGKFDQKYPRYSSKIIAMKSVPEDMPTKAVEIFNIDKISEREISGAHLFDFVIDKISKVNGDFRQEDIIKGWRDFVDKYSKDMFKVLKIRVKCSSGTYMRILAYNIGGFALSIRRDGIGDFHI